MTTEKEINEQIDREIKEWSERIYDGETSQRFVDIFIKALMHIPPAMHKYNMEKVKIMIGKRHDELTRVEIGMIINLIYSTPFENLYENIHEAIETTMAFDKIRDGYNKDSVLFEQKMHKKKQTLMKLSGITKDTARIDMPNKIIAQA